MCLTNVEIWVPCSFDSRIKRNLGITHVTVLDSCKYVQHGFPYENYNYIVPVHFVHHCILQPYGYEKFEIKHFKFWK